MYTRRFFMLLPHGILEAPNWYVILGQLPRRGPDFFHCLLANCNKARMGQTQQRDVRISNQLLTSGQRRRTYQAKHVSPAVIKV